ncbi:TPA: ATP-binding cassette domain-containing protein [Burkholderia cenocepacia]|nr:ATP-binding cassette domain-containing protein [Burkholderia cenocepacia]HDR9813437.1 ATP-binding cassette domain-containing protein [Burkholderia cenocepacia]HDR9820012.1 ATP-binding cassette domain-containing protein [Burkholderia cenocepacia]HDR9830507.1 ATP-binding cassette domain-containing protein [Burkholderia cenocepacia]
MAVDAAEIHVLLAPSGCGKTTTLQMINRLVRPASGRIYLEGRDTGFEVVACEPDIRAARRRLVADVGRRASTRRSRRCDQVADRQDRQGAARQRDERRIGNQEIEQTRKLCAVRKIMPLEAVSLSSGIAIT